MASDSIRISLAQAKELVELLEQGEQAQADALLGEIVKVQHDELFASVGRLTRDLHDSLQDFHVDPRLESLMEDELPDAKNRLNYVIQRTEDAANRTMDAVEASLPIAEQMHQQVSHIQPVWDRLMSRDLELNEFKQLCHDVDSFIRDSGQHAAHLQGLMTEVLMAQDYQDITGQVIRRVIELVQDVEQNLIELLKVFAKREDSEVQADKKKAKPDNIGAEGPIIDAEQRDDVVNGQDEVDDLLSSLGF
ncbi:chemotaxis protein CheZ [Pseudidiomarina planktonica]|uniref:Protein phosphatase CheZ n=1 Tax=Pseudidiomarina planktonica TaxID=1323738 RepID=A0A1Y6EIP9_9GAMM|nr:protein phosphatase CheZ [Pseudidiomarina planktonica]RUO65823.1 protein phosphatase CheZ [Pseudidiomarina planktonica]SMQ62508.1 chemotaxis protein CheZ [Pseudidiomarina planktonica]